MRFDLVRCVPHEEEVPNRPVDVVARCRCGRTFSPMTWAELAKLTGDFRRCPCGLDIKPNPPTFDEIKAAYEKTLKGKKS